MITTLISRIQQWFDNRGVKKKHITQLLQQLALLLEAGINLLVAINLLIPKQKKAIATILIDINHKIQYDGQSLSQSLAAQPKHFDILTRQMIETGEQIGALAMSLNRCVEYRKAREILTSKIITVCAYPMVVLVVAIVITLLFMIIIVPTFAKIFEANNIPLPWLTALIIQLTNQLQSHQHAMMAIIIVFCITCFGIRKYCQTCKLYIDLWLVKLPIIGHLIQKVIQARCLKTLAITYQAGLPLTQGLTISAWVANNHMFRLAFLYLRKQVEAGQMLSEGMKQTTLFSAITIQMTASGESSGRLDQMLNHIATLYENEIDQAIEYLQHLLEPTIMIVLGLLIGILLTAMYLPLFELGIAL